MTIAGPTYVYHRTEPPRIVSTQEEYDALGKGWADTPAAFYDTPAPPQVAGRPRRKAQEHTIDA